jgi:corrinoid protein of di/trimethylamine methyltransferase
MAGNVTEDKMMERLTQSITDSDPDEAKAAVEDALEAGYKPMEILDKGLTKGITVIGDKFAKGEIYLPELLMAADAMQGGVEVLESHWQNMKGERTYNGKIALGTVKGDIHSIGKNIIAALLTSNNFEVFDLGEDISVETFIDKVKEVKPDILGLSSLLTTTMPEQKYVVKGMEEAGIRDSVQIMVGGAPTTPEWADEIGADGWAQNAVLMVKDVKKRLNIG